MACDQHHHSNRQGLSQDTRKAAALAPEYVQVDERNIKDLMRFGKRYAKLLKYKNAQGLDEGTWEAFMKSDLSVVLSVLLSLDVLKIGDYSKLLQKRVLLAIRSHNEQEAKKQFKYLFDLLFSLVQTIDEQCDLLSSEPDYQRILLSIIENRINPAFRRLYNFKQDQPHLFSQSNVTDPTAPIDTINSRALGTLKHFKASGEILPITLPSGALTDQLAAVIGHNLFKQQILILFGGVAALLQNTEVLLERTLSNYPKHEPHYALFLSFLKLFEHARNTLNDYTRRHLDYYFKEVLQLPMRPAQPDQALLSIELQKHIEQHLLPKGTLFKGGKNAEGKELLYALQRDTVFSQAKVADVKAWHLRGSELRAVSWPAASKEERWVFGDRNQLPTSEAGFAITSNLLFLQGGTRVVTITFQMAKGFSQYYRVRRNLSARWKILISGEKGWIEREATSSLGIGDTLETKLTFAPDDDAIVPANPKLHEGCIENGLPQLMARHVPTSTIRYKDLMDQTMLKVDLMVKVEGFKQVALSNELGLLDASKPFKPFGSFPKQKSSFYIGSNEVFQKKLSSLQLHLSPLTNEFSVRYLDGGTWRPCNTKYVRMKPFPITLSSGPPPGNTPLPLTSDQAYGMGATGGFLRLQLNTDHYSLATHMRNVLQALPATYSAPKDLELEDFAIDYVASESIPVFTEENSLTRFYYLTPFGHVAPNAAEPKGLSYHIPHAGACFIGMEQSRPGDTLSLLFHLQEGSNNPLKAIQEVSWSYLSHNNQWKPIPKAQLSDGTIHLTRSGIVTFSLPADAISNSSLFAGKLHWIRLSVEDHIDAVCKLLEVRLQGAQVALLPESETGIPFHQPLPAGTIAKLQTASNAIKSITQISVGFGGRAAESESDYYQRASERLRHKNRALSIWDYEHLVLEKFPQIHLAKCLNHAGFIMVNGQKVFCSEAPGQVTMVCLPVAQAQAATGSSKRYTPIGLLTDVYHWLAERKDPFVELHVINPVFEEVEVHVKVRFRPFMDETFYSEMLKADLDRFISPWAFDDHQKPILGGGINKSMIINFMEERPYVDFIHDLKMFHITRNANGRKSYSDDQEEINTRNAISILSSHFDEDLAKVSHQIDVLPNDSCP